MRRGAFAPIGVLMSVGLLLATFTLTRAMTPQATPPSVEPNAGTWKTWVLTSGAQLRLPAPPDQAATQSELEQVRAAASQRDATARQKIAFWDSGAPGYRWDSIARDELFKHGISTTTAATLRPLALLDVAIYDATVAAWDSKYTYNRPRPTDLDATLNTAVATPGSPSYPSEHAVAAGAAATVLGYLFPDDAETFTSMASEAAQSRVAAGVQYPSDSTAGLDLGRRVGLLVIERAQHDGSDLPWSGTLPSDPNLWNLDGYPDGTVPVFPTFGSLRPWVLESGSQLRPGPPPEPGSEQRLAEVAEVRDFPRTFATNSSAFFWQSTRSLWPMVTEQEIFTARLDTNPPRAARATALVNIAGFDAGVACFDAKYTYWARRPIQVDPTVQPLFPTPAHPSYPSAHGCVSGAQSSVLASLFPADAATLTAQGDEAGNSRLWAGIHYRSDIDVGLALGRAAGAMVIDRAAHDGSQPDGG